MGTSGIVQRRTSEWKTSAFLLLISAAICVILLVVQFALIVFGVQVAAIQIKSFQVLLNGTGALLLAWMFLDRWTASALPVIGVLTVVVPFILELLAILSQY